MPTKADEEQGRPRDSARAPPCVISLAQKSDGAAKCRGARHVEVGRVITAGNDWHAPRRSLIYNGANHSKNGDPSLPPLAFQPGQALFDQADPASVIARTTAPFLGPDIADERTGHVGNVCFAQALVLFQAEWRVYFGMADSRIGCATAPVS